MRDEVRHGYRAPGTTGLVLQGAFAASGAFLMQMLHIVGVADQLGYRAHGCDGGHGWTASTVVIILGP